jgi:5-methylcytosine-specific restriction endonuclease McrA
MSPRESLSKAPPLPLRRGFFFGSENYMGDEFFEDYREDLNKTKNLTKAISKLENRATLCHATSGKFYTSKEWLSFRIQMLKKLGFRCFACGVTAKERTLHVDHIKPRSIYPELSFCEDNIQILCVDCNIGKGVLRKLDFSIEPKRPVKETVVTLPDLSPQMHQLRTISILLKDILDTLPSHDKGALDAFGFGKQERKSLHMKLYSLVGVTHRLGNYRANLDVGHQVLGKS